MDVLRSARRTGLPAAVVVGLPVTASPAMAAPQTASSTASGFVPRDVTVHVGEAVTFTHTNAAAHQVEFKGAGVGCPAHPVKGSVRSRRSCSRSTGRSSWAERPTLAVKSVSGSTAKQRPGVVSTATFSVKVPSGTTRWRVYLQTSRAGGGYEPSFSPTRRVVR